MNNTNLSQYKTEAPPLSCQTLKKTRKSASKISRLPYDVRLWLNQSLLNGNTYLEIIAELESKGFSGFNKHNISVWYCGHYKTWVTEQERLLTVKARAEATLNFVKNLTEEDRNHFCVSNETLLLSQLNDLLQDNDTCDLKEVLREKPELFFKLARTVTAQSEALTRRKKMEEGIKNSKRTKKKEGVSAETLAKIEEGAKIL